MVAEQANIDIESRKLDTMEGSTDEEQLIASCSINSSTINVSVSEVVLLKKQLRFFFMNPIQKWYTRRRFPFKFFVQVIKIFLITFQLCMFGENRYKHMDFSFDNKISFCHLFLKSWDPTREIMAYPPSTGPYAIYTKHEFFNRMDFIVHSYSNVNDAIGPYSYIKHNGTITPIRTCIYNYNLDKDDLSSHERPVEKSCYSITSDDFKNFSMKSYLSSKNASINFEMLKKIKVGFPLKAITVKPPRKHCYRFDILITFDSSDMDGQMLVTLVSQLNRLNCEKHTLHAHVIQNDRFIMTVINGLVATICLVSFTLCARSICRAQKLRKKTIRMYKEIKRTELSMEGKLEFWNFWYIMIIVNDVLIIAGSYLMQEIVSDEYTPSEWSWCSLCLGIGNLLVWFGILRYLGFFKTYNIFISESNVSNVVILTLKKAFPKITRFLLCALLIYAGFVFCGWLVLGPFHMKFNSLATTSECLFSLINGDDMFATFSILETRSSLLWWFSRIYIYCFISLFIYVVLNLFLSVLLDAYETIKDHYTNGFPKSDLQTFIYEATFEEEDGDEQTNMQDDRQNNHGIICMVKTFFSHVWSFVRNPCGGDQGGRCFWAYMGTVCHRVSLWFSDIVWALGNVAASLCSL